jgi:hypothetical protein
LAHIDIELLEPQSPPRAKPFYVTTVHADGLMAASPTGSTAYNMASGGPMAAPNTDVMLLTPVAPHSLSFRPIVLSSCADLRFKISSSSRLAITELNEMNNQELTRTLDMTARVTTTPQAAAGATRTRGQSAAVSKPGATGSQSLRRYAAMASFDGALQVPLGPGDYVQITASRFSLDSINLHYTRTSHTSSHARDSSQGKTLEQQLRPSRAFSLLLAVHSDDQHHANSDLAFQRNAPNTRTNIFSNITEH